MQMFIKIRHKKKIKKNSNILKSNPFDPIVMFGGICYAFVHLCSSNERTWRRQQHGHGFFPRTQTENTAWMAEHMASDKSFVFILILGWSVTLTMVRFSRLRHFKISEWMAVVTAVIVFDCCAASGGCYREIKCSSRPQDQQLTLDTGSLQSQTHKHRMKTTTAAEEHN